MKNKRQRKQCFKDKNVVIIGATGGLGKAYTKMFLQEGANVYLGARSSDKLTELCKEYKDTVRSGQTDIQYPDSIENFVKQVKDEVGYVDYVINSTGYDVRKELGEHSIEEVKLSIDINLTGTIYITRAFLPILTDKQDSTIVHMGGFVDGGLAFPYYSADVAARSGIFSFCEAMNRELKTEGHQYHLMYYCPNPANTQAELPYHPIWKEMKTVISTVEEVAESLKKGIIKKKNVHIMAGSLVNGFAKLNRLSVKLSDVLLMKRYSNILMKYLSAGGK